MRTAAILIALFLSACGQEPTRDEMMQPQPDNTSFLQAKALMNIGVCPIHR